jgi:hypothetical protein
MQTESFVMIHNKPDEQAQQPNGICLRRYGTLCEVWLLQTQLVLVLFRGRSIESRCLGQAEIVRGEQARRRIQKKTRTRTMHVPLVYWHWGTADKSLWLYYTKNILHTLRSTRHCFTRKQRYALATQAIRLIQKQFNPSTGQSIQHLSLDMFSFCEIENSQRFYLALSFHAFVNASISGSYYPCEILTDPARWSDPTPLKWRGFQLALFVLELIGKFNHDIQPPYHEIQPGFRKFQEAVRSGDMFSFLPNSVQKRINRLIPWFVVALSSPAEMKQSQPNKNPYTFLYRFFLKLTNEKPEN